MTHSAPDLEIDLTGLSDREWQTRIEAIGEEHGYCEPLGEADMALFVDAGPRLLVTFETRDAIARRPDGAPRGFDLVRRNGWSLLALISDDEGWFRTPQVWGYVDRLVDDGFFEDFERVLFFGHHAGGYAAAAYSVAAPGARVLALRPVATLDPAVAGWDRRHLAQRRLDFTSRYGYAPDMVEAAHEVHVLHDPLHPADAIHAALFRRPNVTPLRAAHAGSRLEMILEAEGLVAPLIEAAMEDRLDVESFARLWRARRASPHYLRLMLRRLEEAGRPGLLARLCRHGLTTPDAALFARKLAVLQAAAPQHRSPPVPRAG
ncbi:hypothetical protein [Limimaricola pyoseonensis]|uniref:Phosphoadenosine phosphosulfate reductase n=1 Tax=Limimaricola pyoseonensis TaxID=521013 RepID=A0A1G7H385_9RHOB|nr:hypothetical protein [Limimaricola pyoseonensis]SDE94811.1 hypothetical protein SAMN04488567_3056 [Limimaricola pyoseonensis]